MNAPEQTEAITELVARFGRFLDEAQRHWPVVEEKRSIASKLQISDMQLLAEFLALIKDWATKSKLQTKLVRHAGTPAMPETGTGKLFEEVANELKEVAPMFFGDADVPKMSDVDMFKLLRYLSYFVTIATA